MTMRALVCAALCALAAATGACQETQRHDTGLEGLRVTDVQPEILVPGTTIVVSGASFVSATLGISNVRFVGTFGGAAVDFTAPCIYRSSSRVEVKVDADLLGKLGAGDGMFSGTVAVEVKSAVDNRTYSAARNLDLRLERNPTPSIVAVGDGLSFVNQPVEIEGGSFLLGGDEGTTEAVLNGCFRATGAPTCDPLAEAVVPAKPVTAYDRGHVAFPYATSISGIAAGRFEGTLVVRNQLGGGEVTATDPREVAFDIQPPMIASASTTSASLGQYVAIYGGGFVGTAVGEPVIDPTETTLLRLQGTFKLHGDGEPRTLDVQLVPQFFSGPEIRYVVSENDEVASKIDFRNEWGTLAVTVTPIVSKGAATVSGAGVPVTLEVLPVKQIVYLNFSDAYVESLRKFGLRAADPMIRARIFALLRRDYEGVNIEFRDSAPPDFALYATVDITGPDPNGYGLFGFDNTPNRDTDNKRLADYLGGYSANTGSEALYGGVFAESFFGLSMHPGKLAKMAKNLASPLFDQVFDPFRPDVGGNETTATEINALAPPLLTDGTSCPGRDRKTQIACAVYVLGNLIGGTISHENGHSLGLANPDGGDVHDTGDLPNRLMEGGAARSFNERAEVMGEGPGRFCDTAYTYLRKILPSDAPASTVMRPRCD